MGILYQIQNLWPFSALKFDDLRESDLLVKKLSIPKSTKEFVYAVRDPESQSVIYILCVQNLSERSASDAEHLIREIRPDAVVAQVGEIQSFESESENDINAPIPTSLFQVLKKSFVDKISKDEYENVAGGVVLREIFGIGFNGHFSAAKRVAQEIGSSFLLVESPFMNDVTSEENEEKNDNPVLNKFQGLALVPKQVGSTIHSTTRRFSLTNDIRLSSQLVRVSSFDDGDIMQPIADYDVPNFAQSVYPLLSDLHNIFENMPTIGNALAHAQKMLCNVSKGEIVDTQLLSQVYIYRFAVEWLRTALNNAGRVKNPTNKIEFSDLPGDEKSHALFAHALKSQTKKFKSIVAIVDVAGLAGIRKHWNTQIPGEIKDLVEQLVIDNEEIGNQNEKKQRSLTDNPVVAVGAGATAVLGASSLSKVVPVSSFAKIITFKIPASLKIMMTQTQKAVAIALGKTSKVGMASATAEKLQAVTQGVIFHAQKTSLSAMRTALYEIMRKRSVRPVGVLPWATFGCSVATCAGLLVYEDRIECVVESLPAAPAIASLGRGIQSLHQASEAVRHTESFNLQKSIDALLYRFKKNMKS